MDKSHGTQGQTTEENSQGHKIGIGFFVRNVAYKRLNYGRQEAGGEHKACGQFVVHTI
jgi:hypothetical protein